MFIIKGTIPIPGDLVIFIKEYASKDLVEVAALAKNIYNSQSCMQSDRHVNG